MPETKRKFDDISAVAAVRVCRRAHLSTSDLRAGLALVDGAETIDAPLAFVPGAAPDSVPTTDGGQRACYLRRNKWARAPLATVQLAGECLVAPGARHAAERDLASRESAAADTRRAARDRDADLHAYWRDHAPFAVKGAPSSGIHGLWCPRSQDEVRQWSAVSRDQRPTTPQEALAAGVSVLGQSVTVDPSGTVLVTRYGLASVDGRPTVDVASTPLRADGRPRTRGSRGGKARQRRKGHGRTRSAKPVTVSHK